MHRVLCFVPRGKESELVYTANAGYIESAFESTAGRDTADDIGAWDDTVRCCYFYLIFTLRDTVRIGLQGRIAVCYLVYHCLTLPSTTYPATQKGKR